MVHYGWFFGGYIKTPETPLNKINILSSFIFSLVSFYFFIRPRYKYSTLLWFSFIWGVVLRAIGIIFIPLDFEYPDMLSLVSGACNAFIKGHNPYLCTYSTSTGYTNVPLTYFPLLWLPYVPFKFIGMDIRWSNIFSDIGIFLTFNALISKIKPKALLRDYFLLSLIMVLPFMVYATIFFQVSFYLLLICLYVFFIIQGKYIFSTIFIAASFLARQYVIIILPFYIIFLIKRKGLRVSFGHLILIFGVVFSVVSPFMFSGFLKFKRAVLDSNIYSMDISGIEWLSTKLNIAVFLLQLGLTRHIIKLMQLTLMILLYLYYASLKIEDESGLIKITGFAYFIFFFTSTYLHFHYYIAVLLLFCMAYITAKEYNDKAC
jgi:Gpi18-like mannosyltransferase